jgi:hypothetical protein
MHLNACISSSQSPVDQRKMHPSVPERRIRASALVTNLPLNVVEQLSPQLVEIWWRITKRKSVKYMYQYIKESTILYNYKGQAACGSAVSKPPDKTD